MFKIKEKDNIKEISLGILGTTKIFIDQNNDNMIIDNLIIYIMEIEKIIIEDRGMNFGGNDSNSLKNILYFLVLIKKNGERINLINLVESDLSKLILEFEKININVDKIVKNKMKLIVIGKSMVEINIFEDNKKIIIEKPKYGFYFVSGFFILLIMVVLYNPYNQLLFILQVFLVLVSLFFLYKLINKKYTRFSINKIDKELLYNNKKVLLSNIEEVFLSTNVIKDSIGDLNFFDVNDNNYYKIGYNYYIRYQKISLFLYLKQKNKEKYELFFAFYERNIFDKLKLELEKYGIKIRIDPVYLSIKQNNI